MKLSFSLVTELSWSTGKCVYARYILLKKRKKKIVEASVCMVFCFWNEQMSESVETVSSGEVGFRDQVRDQVRPHIVTSSAELLLLVGIQKPGRRPQSLLVVVWTTSLYLNLFYLFKSLCVTWSSVPFTWSDSLSASFYRLLEKKPSKWSRGRSSRQIDAVSSPVQDSTVNTRHLPTFEPFVKFKLLTKTQAEREREKKKKKRNLRLSKHLGHRGNASCDGYKHWQTVLRSELRRFDLRRNRQNQAMINFSMRTWWKYFNALLFI